MALGYEMAEEDRDLNLNLGVEEMEEYLVLGSIVGKIIEYTLSTINAYPPLSHESWVPP